MKRFAEALDKLGEKSKCKCSSRLTMGSYRVSSQSLLSPFFSPITLVKLKKGKDSFFIVVFMDVS
jgi:hypothetical protein